MTPKGPVLLLLLRSTSPTPLGSPQGPRTRPLAPSSARPANHPTPRLPRPHHRLRSGTKIRACRVARPRQLPKVHSGQETTPIARGGNQLRPKDFSLGPAVESSLDALRHAGLPSGNRCQSVTSSVTQCTVAFAFTST